MDVNLKWSIFKKTWKNQYKNQYFGVGGGSSWRQNRTQDGSQNGTKIDKHEFQNRSEFCCIDLFINVYCIVNGFWVQKSTLNSVQKICKS